MKTKTKKGWEDRIAFLSKQGSISLPKRTKKKKLLTPLTTKKPAKLLEALLEERAQE